MPHCASIRDREREVIVLRSDNGQTWREHVTPANDTPLRDTPTTPSGGILGQYVHIDRFFGKIKLTAGCRERLSLKLTIQCMLRLVGAQSPGQSPPRSSPFLLPSQNQNRARIFSENWH